jgi:hypothetical protein
LVSKDKDLGFQRSPRPEQSDEGARQINPKDRSSGASITRFAVAVSRFGFAVGTRIRLTTQLLVGRASMAGQVNKQEDRHVEGSKRK